MLPLPKQYMMQDPAGQQGAAAYLLYSITFVKYKWLTTSSDGCKEGCFKLLKVDTVVGLRHHPPPC